MWSFSYTAIYVYKKYPTRKCLHEIRIYSAWFNIFRHMIYWNTLCLNVLLWLLSPIEFGLTPIYIYYYNCVFLSKQHCDAHFRECQSTYHGYDCYSLILSRCYSCVYYRLFLCNMFCVIIELWYNNHLSYVWFSSFAKILALLPFQM